MALAKAKKNIYVQETTITELPIKINRLETIKTYTQHGLIIKEEKEKFHVNSQPAIKLAGKGSTSRARSSRCRGKKI